MNKLKLLFISVLILSVKFSQNQNLISGIEGQSTYYEMASNIQSIYPKISVYNSGGSMENLIKILNDSSNIDLAFVQYDVLLNEQMRNPSTKQKIEIIFPMYYEEVHLITKKGNEINSISDIQNKTIAIGSISQGTNVTAKNIISILNLKCKTIDISYRDAFAALLDNKIDAFFFVGGVPIKNLTTFPTEISDLIKLVPIENEKLQGIYRKTTIRKESYPWLTEDVKTISIQSFIVQNKDKKNNNFDINAFISTIYDYLPKFKKSKEYHPKWDEIEQWNIAFPNWPINKTTSNLFNKN